MIDLHLSSNFFWFAGRFERLKPPKTLSHPSPNPTRPLTKTIWTSWCQWCLHHWSTPATNRRESKKEIELWDFHWACVNSGHRSSSGSTGSMEIPPPMDMVFAGMKPSRWNWRHDISERWCRAFALHYLWLVNAENDENGGAEENANEMEWTSVFRSAFRTLFTPQIAISTCLSLLVVCYKYVVSPSLFAHELWNNATKPI